MKVSNLLYVLPNERFLPPYFGDVSLPNKGDVCSMSRKMITTATTTLRVYYIFSELFTGISTIIILMYM